MFLVLATAAATGGFIWLEDSLAGLIRADVAIHI